MEVRSLFSPEIEKLLRDGFDADPFAPRAPRQRQPRRTVTLSPEVYERLKDYAARHNQTVSEAANRKLETIPTEAEEAELDALIATYKPVPEVEAAIDGLIEVSKAQASKAHRQDDLFTVQPVTTYVN